jgi:hypothetical protein
MFIQLYLYITKHKCLHGNLGIIRDTFINDFLNMLLLHIVIYNNLSNFYMLLRDKSHYIKVITIAYRLMLSKFLYNFKNLIDYYKLYDFY